MVSKGFNQIIFRSDTRFQVQLKCVQTIRAIFQTNSKVSVPFIHMLAPRMIDVLNNSIKQIKANQSVTQIDSQLILELFASLEVLIEMAQNDKSKHIFNHFCLH